MGGEVLSKNKLSVEVLLLPLLAGADCTSSLPSALEELPEELRVSLVLTEALERRRMLRSLRKDGIVAGRPAGEGGWVYG